MPVSTQKSWHFVRLSMVLCWVLWLITFFISMTLFQAILQVRVIAQVVPTAEKGLHSFKDDYVQAVPMDAVSREAMDELLIRYYLEMRYARIPDVAEMKRRWGYGGIVAYFSTVAAYRSAHYDVDGLETIDGKTPIVVDIRYMQLRKDLKTTYEVILDLYESDGNGHWKKVTRNLTVSFTHVAERVFRGRNLSNPYGLIVTGVDDRKSL